jgi:hypothetical protein
LEAIFNRQLFSSYTVICEYQQASDNIWVHAADTSPIYNASLRRNGWREEEEEEEKANLNDIICCSSVVFSYLSERFLRQGCHMFLLNHFIL